MPAESDCELIRDAFLAQPANALSSLAFLAVGLMVLRSRPVLGALAVGVGIGSFVFHGPMPGSAQWVHDVTLVALVGGLGLERSPRLLIGTVALLAALFAHWPASAVPITVGVGLLAAVSIGTSRRPPYSSRLAASLGLLVVGFVVQTLSRADGPLCRPESLMQGHALWHLLAAGALLAYAETVTSEATAD